MPQCDTCNCCHILPQLVWAEGGGATQGRGGEGVM